MRETHRPAPVLSPHSTDNGNDNQSKGTPVADNPLAKKAKDLLAARMATVEELGKLLDQKAGKEKELADLADSIDKAITMCVDAGWKPDELAQLGIPKPGKRRAPKTAAAAPVSSPQPPAAP